MLDNAAVAITGRLADDEPAAASAACDPHAPHRGSPRVVDEPGDAQRAYLALRRGLDFEPFGESGEIAPDTRPALSAAAVEGRAVVLGLGAMPRPAEPALPEHPLSHGVTPTDARPANPELASSTRARQAHTWRNGAYKTHFAYVANRTTTELIPSRGVLADRAPLVLAGSHKKYNVAVRGGKRQCLRAAWSYRALVYIFPNIIGLRCVGAAIEGHLPAASRGPGLSGACGERQADPIERATSRATGGRQRARRVAATRRSRKQWLTRSAISAPP